MAIDRLMPKHNEKSGFALFVAVIFMSVMLLFGLALGSLSYKQQVLASSSVESQYAFYAADAALECGMYYDQQQNLFAYPPSNPGAAPAMICDGANPYSTSYSYGPTQWVVNNRIKLDSNTRCADLTVYKPNGAGITTVYAQGYDVPCATVAVPNNARFVSRGLFSKYSTGTNTVTYATLNPADKGSGENLSNGNLTATKNVTGWGTGLVRATIGKSSGKWYWEVTLTNDPLKHFLAGLSRGTLAGSYLGSDTNGWGWYSNEGSDVWNAIHVAFNGSSFGTGTVLGFALDMDTGSLKGYLNGTLIGAIANSLSGTFYPAIDMYDSGMVGTVNFGATPFTYSVPAGYNAGIYQ